MNTTTRNEVLASIDAMNDVVQESEFSVLCSLVDQMDKASVILENYNGTDLEAFAIYQEADEAVQQGDPSGDANAEAKKKSDSVLMKILMFVPNVLKKIWAFIKQAWNGEIVPTAKKAAEVVQNMPEKTVSIIDKIIGKDESWIKEHSTELGITGGVLTAVLGFVAYLNKDKISDIIKKWLNSIKSFFKKLQTSAIDTAVIFDLTVGNSIKTNVGIHKITEALKAIPGFIKNVSAYNIYSKTGINPKAIDTDFNNCFSKADEIANVEILSDAPEEQKISVVLQNFVELGSVIDQLKNNEADINNIKLTEEQIKQLSAAFPTKEDNDKFKQNCTKFNAIMGSIGALIGSTVANVKNIIAKLVGIIKKSEDISNSNNGDSSDQGDQGDTNDQNSTENAGDAAEAQSDEAAESEPKNASGETESNDTDNADSVEQPDVSNADEASTETFDPASLTKGQQLTTAEAEKILKQLGVLGEDKSLNEKISYKSLSATNKKVFTGSNNQQYKGLRKVKTDDNTIAWVVEYSDEELSDDDDVVTESHSPYYW
jgi:hypothetical protein